MVAIGTRRLNHDHNPRAGRTMNDKIAGAAGSRLLSQFGKLGVLLLRPIIGLLAGGNLVLETGHLETGDQLVASLRFPVVAVKSMPEMLKK